MCQYFLRILAETTFSPHFLLSQRLKENTNGDVIYSSLQSSRKLPANVLPEGELWDQRPFFTKEFLTKSVLTIYAAQTGLSPLSTPSPVTLVTLRQGTCVHYSSFTTGKRSWTTELNPLDVGRLEAEPRATWFHVHCLRRDQTFTKSAHLGKETGVGLRWPLDSCRRNTPTLVQDFPPAHFEQRSSNLSFSSPFHPEFRCE